MYVKVFSSILTSSIWSEDLPTRIVWITLLAMAEKDGGVMSSLSGVARMANVSVEDCQRAIEKFIAPDPESQTQDYDGRRLVERPGGWLILNYVKYRDLQNAESRREQWRQAAKRHREKAKARQQASSTSSSSLTNHQMSGEADSDARVKDSDPKGSESPLPLSISVRQEVPDVALAPEGARAAGPRVTNGKPEAMGDLVARMGLHELRATAREGEEVFGDRT